MGKNLVVLSDLKPQDLALFQVNKAVLVWGQRLLVGMNQFIENCLHTVRRKSEHKSFSEYHALSGFYSQSNEHK